jgi:DNA modification methylase
VIADVLSGAARWHVEQGDCLDVLRAMPDASVDSVVCDPPYGLSREPDVAEVLRHWLAGDDYKHRGGGFMGRAWDSFVPGPSVWRECLRVLKPGGHLLAFFGTRTVDLGGMAIRLAGFEIRDSLVWMYAQGFPKSLDVSKAIDKAAGAEREVVGEYRMPADSTAPGCRPSQGLGYEGAAATGIGRSLTAPATADAARWSGWGSALKPAHEPIVMARKPLTGTVAANVLAHGTGAVNVDGCRVAGPPSGLKPYTRNATPPMGGAGGIRAVAQAGRDVTFTDHAAGRWPANVLLSHTPECEEAGTREARGMWNCAPGCPVAALDEQTGTLATRGNKGPSIAAPRPAPTVYGTQGERDSGDRYNRNDSGGASRFFYCAKASRSERNAGLPEGERSTHPTVKPIAVMQWLARLVTPPGGVVLDPFTGSGSTGAAAMREGFRFVGIEREAEYVEIARRRIAHGTPAQAALLTG